MKENNRKLKRITICVWGLLLMLFSLATGVHYVSSIEQSRVYVSPEEIDEAKTVIFYKDDCPDCQKVLPMKIVKNFFEQDSVFINLNNQKNKRYIRIYKLNEVPTVIERNLKNH